MLLRVYRVTDRFGMLIVKSSAAAGDRMLESTHTTLDVVKKGSGGILSLVMIALVLIFTAVKTILLGLVKIIAFVLMGLFALVSVIASLGWRVAGGARAAAAPGRAGTLSGGGGGGGTAVRARKDRSGGMVQNTAYDEIDVRIAEDPLKVQNRRLSMAVMVMGIVVIVAVIWATDPSRSGSGTKLPAAADNAGNSSLALNATPVPIQENAVIALATPFPTATPQPLALRAGGTIAYTVRERGQTDIWAVGVGSDTPLRILNDVSDERDPAWTLDGKRLAYASPQDGNWEIYTYDPASQTSSRITYELSFQGNPVWSSDGLFLAYESYQGNNLDIYAQPLDGADAPYRITDSPAPDFSPAWSPDGRRIAFVSWRDGNQDIYIFDLDNPGQQPVNFTGTPGRNEDYPAWSPDGRYLAYSAIDAGREKVFVQSVDNSSPAEVIGLGRTPAWSPDSSALTYAVDADDKSQTYLYAVPFGRAGGVSAEVATVPYGATNPVWSQEALPSELASSGGLDLAVREPLFIEQAQEYPNDAPYRLQSLLDVRTEQPYLSDRVNDSFNALRARVAALSGLDYLSALDDAWWNLERQPEPGEERRNWHITGRAFAITRTSIQGFPAPIEIVREDTEIQTTWRVFLRVADNAQSGNLGEPLRRLPWDFLSQTQGDVQAYNEGGRLKAQFPEGYYIDLTQLAADYGWERFPAGADWRANANSMNYWLFYKPEGLSWCAAMLEIHTPGSLINFNCTPGS